MADPGVFLLRDEATLVPMQAASFATEDHFQRLLAAFPALLAGDQIDAAEPRRFLLVAREQGIAAEEGAGDRWSLDHLFLDQDGIPTLVEVKRSTDTRIRREVVGQMLDYAANAILHWPVEALQARLSARCDAEGQDAAVALRELIGPEGDTDAFWNGVRTNLQAGRVRLLFVADRIPLELRRVVEFLNRQMQPAEVLAVELRQYEGQGLRTLVPLVIGQTEASSACRRRTTGAGVKRRWDEASLLAELERVGEEAVRGARTIMAWAHARRLGEGYGEGQLPAWTPVILVAGQKLLPISIWGDGALAVNFQYLAGKPAIGDEVTRTELLERLNAIGYGLPESGLTRRPNVKASVWAEPGRLEALLPVLDWLLGKAHAAEA
ncbi:hypothetical protein [Methylobacterium sp. A54F]